MQIQYWYDKKLQNHNQEQITDVQIQVLFLAKKLREHKLNVDMAWKLIMYFKVDK